MTVLVVEESRTLRAILRRHLEELGFGVQACATVAEASALLRSAQDLALLVIDDEVAAASPAFLDQWRSRVDGMIPRTLLLTGQSRPTPAGLVSGREAWMRKPFDTSALEERLRAIHLAPRGTAPIRVLVVDDAVVVRGLLTQLIGEDPHLAVAGTAANGEIALHMIRDLAPDVVTLDIEMPVMNGLETLAALRRDHPRLPVVMVSSLTERGAAATLDALALGANDYVTKPAHMQDGEAARAALRAELLPRLKQFHPAPRPPQASPPLAAPAVPAVVLRATPPRPVEVLAIGTSTGGPEALAALFAALPRDLPVPIVVVQHMPPTFTRLLAERLSARGNVPVREAQAGDVLAPGRAWLAPGDYHMQVVRQGVRYVVALNQEEKENSCRPAVDVLFRSVAQAYGPHVLAVVLTGMGQDGLRGCMALRHAEAQVLAQDEATSVVWGMPGAVARAGLADKVLPLSDLASEIVRRVSGPPA